ncbi:MAG: DUF2802 domain-containing protein [Gammaproteobacteria bacterium]|nr:DUF2802 domain-containing protein [Gammaproteobacteria bacterium]
MNFAEYTQWIVLGIGVFSLFNLLLVISSFSKIKRERTANAELQKRVGALEDDVKAIYDSVSNMGGKINTVMKDHRILKDQQEQLTLKEPSQQSYKNAIQQLRNGDPINKIVESSGLSQGEIELLKLLNASEFSKEN